LIRSKLRTFPRAAVNSSGQHLYTGLPNTHPRGVRLFTCQRATDKRTRSLSSSSPCFFHFTDSRLRQGRRNVSVDPSGVNTRPRSSPEPKFLSPSRPLSTFAHRQKDPSSANPDDKIPRQVNRPPVSPIRCHFKRVFANRNVRPKPSNRRSSVTAANLGRWYGERAREYYADATPTCQSRVDLFSVGRGERSRIENGRRCVKRR
jgi:hypothetical protein